MILERPRFCLPPRYKDRSMDPEKHDMVIAAVADLDAARLHSEPGDPSAL